MPCTSCFREKPAVSRGLCNACYQRWRKTGTTDYQRLGRITICAVGGCGKRAAAKGLCDTHRKRMDRHGHIEETRPDSWGAKNGHPLNGSWMHLQRFKATHPIDPAWNDFLQFIADVGERPTPKHKLFARDLERPIGPTNFAWKRSVTERLDGETRADHAKRAQRSYRAVRPEAFRGYELKKNYGLSAQAYEDMGESQGHVCAICRKAETVEIRGKRTCLAIDHNHATGAVRGLLCASCNRGLGLFADNPDRLRAAIEYLERHAPTPDPSDEG